MAGIYGPSMDVENMHAHLLHAFDVGEPLLWKIMVEYGSLTFGIGIT